MALSTVALSGAFSDPVFQSQAVFRALMDAMARPGTIVTLPARAEPPTPLGPAAGAVALTLCDGDTPVYLAPPLLASALPGWLAFHTGAPVTRVKAEAHFAFTGPEALCLSAFSAGTQDYPDRSTTLVVELLALAGGRRLTLRGPGIEATTEIAPAGLPEIFPDLWAENRALFPRGVDLILAAGSEILCLPRTTRLTP
ncbi:phosphonate C-P lyase system protein PhnH [Ensifer soli]|uniref:phosphonate C-P lyase system protein PhnH n=1 Tax=Ciceribacter sp. sgz301302 TaxID=3342379 RepID=UPI0035B9D920